MRGYFEIGIYHTKAEVNVGTLWRSAYQLGANGIYTIGRRYKKQASDTPKVHRHIPLRNYEQFDEFIKHLPKEALLIGIEIGGIPLSGYCHPERAIYILGAEDYGLPELVLSKCKQVISIESVRLPSFNVAVAGSLVMYDRFIKASR